MLKNDKRQFVKWKDQNNIPNSFNINKENNHLSTKTLTYSNGNTGPYLDRQKQIVDVGISRA
jgi:hypothetical protein